VAADARIVAQGWMDRTYAAVQRLALNRARQGQQWHDRSRRAEQAAGKGETTAQLTPLISGHPAELERAYVTSCRRKAAIHEAALASWPGLVVWAAGYRSGETNGDSHLEQPTEEAPTAPTPGVTRRQRGWCATRICCSVCRRSRARARKHRSTRPTACITRCPPRTTLWTATLVGTRPCRKSQ
jgi:hypothetical protein